MLGCLPDVKEGHLEVVYVIFAELYSWVEAAGLQFVSLNHPGDKFRLNLQYLVSRGRKKASRYIHYSDVKELVRGLDTDLVQKLKLLSFE